MPHQELFHHYPHPIVQKEITKNFPLKAHDLEEKVKFQDGSKKEFNSPWQKGAGM